MPMNRAEARQALLDAIGVCPCTDCAAVPRMLDAYVALCVAETMAPREPSPELVEAEKWLRDCANAWAWQRSPEARAIAAELDRLRANIATLEIELRKARGIPANPCTGSEFLTAMAAAIRPRTDEEIKEAIEDLGLADATDKDEAQRTAWGAGTTAAMVIEDAFCPSADEARRMAEALDCAGVFEIVITARKVEP